jgi:hypothetical protein
MVETCQDRVKIEKIGWNIECTPFTITFKSRTDRTSYIADDIVMANMENVPCLGDATSTSQSTINNQVTAVLSEQGEMKKVSCILKTMMTSREFGLFESFDKRVTSFQRHCQAIYEFISRNQVVYDLVWGGTMKISGSGLDMMIKAKSFFQPGTGYTLGRSYNQCINGRAGQVSFSACTDKVSITTTSMNCQYQVDVPMSTYAQSLLRFAKELETHLQGVTLPCTAEKRKVLEEWGKNIYAVYAESQICHLANMADIETTYTDIEQAQTYCEYVYGFSRWFKLMQHRAGIAISSIAV